MKKFLATILCCLLAVSAFLMTGCSSVFDGNYTEATEQELSTFSQSVAANPTNEEFDYNSGLSIKVDISMQNNGENLNVSLNTKTIEVDGQLQASGNMAMKTPAMFGEEALDVKADFWFKDGYIYSKMNQNGTELKIKDRCDFSEYIDELVSAMQMVEFSPELDNYLELSAEMGSGVKILVDHSNNKHKIKIEIPEQTIQASTASLFAVLVYDANYKLEALKFDMKANAQGVILTANYEVQAWNGSVSLPSDLNTYIGF